MQKIDALAASGLVSSATLMALVSMLRRKGVITELEEREVYEQALMMLEQQQAGAPDLAMIYEAAREVIEEQLR